MSIYTVTQAETLSGIKAHTLRIWEKRYTFLNPERTSGNIRFYSDLQMRKLLNIGILIKNGFKISQIDAMSDKELNEAVTEIVLLPVSDQYMDHVLALTLSMLEMDEAAFNTVFDNQVIKTGLVNTMLHVVYPFLKHVGILWTTSKSIPAQEHFVSNLIRQKLIAAIDTIKYTSKPQKRIAFFLPEGEQHELGLLLAAFIAKNSGWRIYYLGQNMPYDNIEHIVRISNCDVLMSISVLNQSNDSNLYRLIHHVLEVTNVPLLLSGTLINQDFIHTSSRIIPITNPDDLIRFLKSY